MRNKVRAVIDSMEITPYRAIKDTGLADNTVYGLYNHPEKWMTADTFDAFMSAYPHLTPNDLIEHVPD